MRARALALLALLSAAVGCGRAGPPVAPQVRAPQPVSDLSGAVEDGAISLTWTNPQRRADQAVLRDLTEVRLYRTEDDGVMPAKPALAVQGKIAGYREIAVIPLAVPGPAVVRGHSVSFVDREGLRFGRRYTYVVLVEDARERVSPPSNRLSLVLIAPPEALGPPTVDAGDRTVRVRWQPASRLVDGGAPGPLAYEVSRSSAPQGAAEVVFPVPPGDTQYLDRTVENERTYYYSVRALRQESGTTARGATSPRVAATPGRMTPPAPPTNLVAAPSAGTVRLSWTPSPDSNVAGYIVYRGGPNAELARLGSVSAPATTFTDRGLAPGTYRYVVTAQDATARANESAPSNEVSVTLP